MKEYIREHTQELLVTQIFSLCIKKPRSIEEICIKIFKSGKANNVVRVYQCVEIMMQRGILVPVFTNRTLRFKIDKENLGIT